LAPSIVTGDFRSGDCLMFMTDGVSRAIDSVKYVELLTGVEKSAIQLSDVAVAMLHSAQEQGATDNMTVCLVKSDG